MRRVGKLLCFLTVLMLLGTIQYKSHADMGDFAGDSDWDSGWDSSWDSGDDWSSSWGDDDDDSWSSSWGDDDDDDNGYYYWGGWTSDGGSGYDGGGDGDGSGSLDDAYLPEDWEEWTSEQWAEYHLNRLYEIQEEKDDESALAGFFVLAAITELIIIIRMKRKNRVKVKPPVQIPKTKTNRDALTQLKENDRGFDENAFKERVSHMYVELQKAWMAKEWEPMRAYLTDDLFNQLNKQLQGYIDRKQTNHVERIAVLDTTIVGYSKKDKLDYLTVRLSTRICDYVTDDNSGKVVRGSQDRELFMTYDWTLVRAQGVQTPEKDAEVHCPNCGAPLDKGASVRCPYCGSVLYGTEYDWTLKTIKGISQRS